MEAIGELIGGRRMGEDSWQWQCLVEFSLVYGYILVPFFDVHAYVFTIGSDNCDGI